MQKLQKKKITYFFKFVALLFFLNTAFFVFYAKHMDLHSSFLAAIFILFFSVNFAFLYHIFRNRFLRIFLFLFHIIMLIYALINFAYYEVFQTFLSFSFERMREVNMSMAALLREFYFLVPSSLYIAALSISLFLAIAMYFYGRGCRKLNLEILSFDDINFIDENIKSGGRLSSVLLLAILFILFNFGLGSYVIAKRNANLSEMLAGGNYFSKSGFYGFVFYEVVDAIAREVDSFFPEETNASEGNVLANKFDIIKKDLENLNSLVRAKSAVKKSGRVVGGKRHVVVYQMESVGSWALTQEPTPMPFLSELLKKHNTIKNFYPNSCTTINSEMASLCGFYPESYGPISDIYANNNYYCLPTILKERYRYTSSYYHANTSDFWNRNLLGPRWGFDNMYFTPYYENRKLDESVLRDMVGKIKNATSSTFNYFVGFTSHAPHNDVFIKHFLDYDKKIITPYEGALNNSSLKAGTDEETIRNYFGFLRAVDDGIQVFFKEMEEAGLLQNTIIVIYGDHRYYNLFDSDKFQSFSETNKVPLLIYAPEEGLQKNLAENASQVDIAPTILNLIEGYSYDKPKSFVGESVFSPAHQDNVLSRCLGEAYFINNDLVIQGNTSHGAYWPIKYFDDLAKFRLDDYIENIKNIIAVSDKMYRNNILGQENVVGGLASASSSNSVIGTTTPQSTDSDNDGLSDLREDGIKTDKFTKDSDHDGYDDGVEVLNGYNPLGSGRALIK